MATLAATFGGAKLAMGGEKKQSTTVPPINAKSYDEEKYIKYVNLAKPTILHIPRLPYFQSKTIESMD